MAPSGEAVGMLSPLMIGLPTILVTIIIHAIFLITVVHFFRHERKHGRAGLLFWKGPGHRSHSHAGGAGGAPARDLRVGPGICHPLGSAPFAGPVPFRDDLHNAGFWHHVDVSIVDISRTA